MHLINFNLHSNKTNVNVNDTIVTIILLLLLLLLMMMFSIQLYFRWLFYGADEMITQLEWLRDTLISAEMNREKVHILGNIVWFCFQFIHIYPSRSQAKRIVYTNSNCNPRGCIYLKFHSNILHFYLYSYTFRRNL